MGLAEELKWRGLIKDKTFHDVSWLDKPGCFYLGIDASADSLTVGNLAIILLAKRLCESGWKTILVAGGGTSLVGDPGGKAKERALNDIGRVKTNIASVENQIKQLFSTDKFTLLNNYDWLSKLSYLDFLRDVGKQFSMTELIQREFVSERMGKNGSGISYAEFSYSLIQGYDYWHLFRKYGTNLQIGGSDQWGNMLSGVALIRKKEGKQTQALSMPLVVDKTTGQKFGKSEVGAVWLDSTKTSPTQFYQFWMNTDDADVENYLKIYTFLSMKEVERVMEDHKNDKSKRLAQEMLAQQVTKIVHGDNHGSSATNITKYLTGQISLSALSTTDLFRIKSEIPSAKVKDSASIIDVLVKTGLATSNSIARTILSSGGIYINSQQVDRDHFETTDFQNGRLLLRRGKAYKDSALVELE